MQKPPRGESGYPTNFANKAVPMSKWASNQFGFHMFLDLDGGAAMKTE